MAERLASFQEPALEDSGVDVDSHGGSSNAGDDCSEVASFSGCNFVKELEWNDEFQDWAEPVVTPPAFDPPFVSKEVDLSQFVPGDLSAVVTMTVPEYYVVDTVINIGAVGIVCSGTDLRVEKPVAIKKITEPFLVAEESKRTVREIQYQSALQHPNIVAISDVVLGPDDSLYVVQEIMSSDLFWVIQSGQALSRRVVLHLTFQLLRGLRYLHSANLCHRDVKPSNCVVNAACDLKLCDFGMSRVISNAPEEERAYSDYVTTRWYRAPEVTLSMKYDTKLDVWAVGCIFAELISRNPLFEGQDPRHQMEKIFAIIGGPSETYITTIPSAAARDFVRERRGYPRVPWAKAIPTNEFGPLDGECLVALDRMLALDGDDRASADEAMKLPLFEDAALQFPDTPLAETKLSDEWEDEINFSRVQECRAAIQRVTQQFRPEPAPKLAALDLPKQASFLSSVSTPRERHLSRENTMQAILAQKALARSESEKKLSAPSTAEAPVDTA
mmetsp:Transcript_52544/g.122905  ORF Transcript_52544/g.122905 Transcript_52544/m.122905 type:complete len:501 (-) Transcript_52544:108-1610(-)